MLFNVQFIAFEGQNVVFLSIVQVKLCLNCL